MKKFFVAFMLLSLAAVSSAMFYDRSLSLYSWFLWRTQSAEPIELSGSLERIYEFQGRDSGKQNFVLRVEGENRRLDSVLSKKEINALNKAREELLIKYYPTATGKEYVFYIKGLGSGKTYYEGVFHNEIWPGFFMLLLCAFFAAVPLFSLFGVVKVLKSKE